MSKYKLVIFDMDGTLADTSPGILNSIRYTIKQMGLNEISLEQMYSHVGPPMEESYNRNFGLTGDSLKQAVSYHKEYAIQKGFKELTWLQNNVQNQIRIENTPIQTQIVIVLEKERIDLSAIVPN